MACVFHLAKLAKRLALIGGVMVAAGCGDDLADPTSANKSSDDGATLSITPAVGLSAVGSTIRFTATVTDAEGESDRDPAVSWESADPDIASVDDNGLVRANAPGTVRIVAATDDLSDTATVTVTGDDGPPPGYHVAPGGSPAGAGTPDDPWDLATALNGGNGLLGPGDQVWLRGGTYRGVFFTSLNGQPADPITFRQFPGERATIDGGLRVQGADLIFWGFEIMQSAPLSHGTTPALLIEGARNKYINLIVHDAAQQGITFWDRADDAEVYGCIVYNNGLHENKDHGIYIHNSVGTKRVEDNVFFNNLAYGIHAYAGPEDDYQRNIHITGNVSFNNGSISAQWSERVNLLIGAEVWGTGMRAIENMLYFSGTAGRNMWIGYTAASGDVEVRGNTVWGGDTVLVVGNWENATFRDNTLGGTSHLVTMSGLTPGDQSWSGNRYYRAPTALAWSLAGVSTALAAWNVAAGIGTSGVAQSSTPSSPTVFVRPNRYEAGRAHIVVYNWTRQSQVGVNVAGVLETGQRYQVRNVQDPLGAPVAQGTYAGGSITLPMTGVAPPPRLGRSTRTPPRTGPHFDAFVITVTR